LEVGVLVHTDLYVLGQRCVCGGVSVGPLCSHRRKLLLSSVPGVCVTPLTPQSAPSQVPPHRVGGGAPPAGVHASALRPVPPASPRRVVRDYVGRRAPHPPPPRLLLIHVLPRPNKHPRLPHDPDLALHPRPLHPVHPPPLPLAHHCHAADVNASRHCHLHAVRARAKRAYAAPTWKRVSQASISLCLLRSLVSLTSSTCTSPINLRSPLIYSHARSLRSQVQHSGDVARP